MFGKIRINKKRFARVHSQQHAQLKVPAFYHIAGDHCPFGKNYRLLIGIKESKSIATQDIAGENKPDAINTFFICLFAAAFGVFGLEYLKEAATAFFGIVLKEFYAIDT